MIGNFLDEHPQWIKYLHKKTAGPPKEGFHLHEQFEIYFYISGNINFFVEKTSYPLQYGNLLVFNNLEIHKASYLPGEPYERITIHFNPAISRQFCTENCNLLAPFLHRPKGKGNKINLTIAQTNELTQIFQRIDALNKNSYIDTPILKLTYFIELLVFINRVFSNPHKSEEPSQIPDRLRPILDYIETNLQNVKLSFYKQAMS